MPKPLLESGFIEEPVFARGFDPGQHKWHPPPKPSPWKRHFELGRQNPGKWMMVSEVKKGGCRARLEAIQRDRNRIEGHLNRQCPLERWEIRQVTLDGTWCDRELWMRYLGELTPEEDARDRAQRRAKWEARTAKVIANRERKAQAARDKAREEEAAAQVRIRGRRRAGG